jgi:hypothetical protein
MQHPFYDPSKLTDDEILLKLGKCYNYMAAQERLGHDPTVDSIKQVIESLELEKTTRFQKMVNDETTKLNPTMLAPIELGTLETEDNDKDTDNNENRY